MKIFISLFWITILSCITNSTYAQEYFESFEGERIYIPAYSEYYQDYDNPANSKAFLANYMDGIIVFDAAKALTPIDTIKLGNGFIRTFDYEPFGKGDNKLIALITSEKELFIYNMTLDSVIIQKEVKYALNDLQFSNIDPHILWGADKYGNLLKINIQSQEISYHPIHKKGIARIELFMDKIITSSFDHTIKITNQINLLEEQELKYQVPPLEFDVSADGLIAIAAARGVALYNIVDKQWLYGKKLLNKKAQIKEEEKTKSEWNPYQNSEIYSSSGTSKKITFIRKSQLIAFNTFENGLQPSHLS
jgi:hypothetical protein